MNIMKKLDFLKKVKIEGKLKLTEPSNEVKQAYLDKSESYLESAKLLLKNKKLEEATSMTYYSMYYSLLALLYHFGIKSENHSASIILLKKLFGIDNKDILEAKKERIDKQYYVDFKIAKRDVVNLIKTAEKFNADIFDFLEKATINQIKTVRQKFKDWFGE